MANLGFFDVGAIGSTIDGVHWDEKGGTDIVQIFIWHDEEGIAGIRFQYMENGRLVVSHLHGACNGNKFDIVKLDYPSEHITSISGYELSDADADPDRVGSLKIGTNCREYGPYGRSRGGYTASYCFRVGNQFGGFYGRATVFGLVSIGVFLKPMTTLEPNADIKPVKQES